MPHMSDFSSLKLDYCLEAGKSIARHSHQGSVRILQSLYPEGDLICHNVLIHPPGGLVGGDLIDIQVNVAEGAQALVTTPGATRFYRSEHRPAIQNTHLKLRKGARLQWFPLEAIAYDACMGKNHLKIELEPEAEMMGWDVSCLGLPFSGLPFTRGGYSQHIEFPGIWREHGALQGDDVRLLNGPCGLAGNRCLAMAFFASGTPLDRGRRQLALDAARDILQSHCLAATAGASSPHPQIVVVRVISPVCEPAMDLLRGVRAQWLGALWRQMATVPRIWSM